MNFDLPAELQRWQAQLREFVSNELQPHDSTIESSGEIPTAALQKMARLGLFGTHTPRDYGGLGLSMLGSCVAVEELARAHSAYYYRCGLNIHLGSKAIELDGSEALKRSWLPRIASGEIVAAFALTEPEAGSDASAITMSAVRDGDTYVLDGRKTFITNAAEAGVFTVLATLDPKQRSGAVCAFVVPADAPGLEVGRRIPMVAGRGTSHCDLHLRKCRVPAGNLIGAENQGFASAMKCLDSGRIHWGAYCVGVATRLLELASHRVATRTQFNRPLISHQGIEWRIADMIAALRAARLVTYEAAWRYDNEPAARRGYGALAKLVGADMVCDIADQTLQIFGGLGYSKDCPVERMWRESRVVKILDGTSEMMRRIVARELLPAI